MDDLIFASVKDLAQAIQAKEVSSEEVVKACLQRIDVVNPELNAVVQLTPDTALEQARAADAALARGDIKGLLHGIPMTIKDSFETAGMISTGGTKGRATFVPDQDATVVARLRASGAILLGKTNTPELTLAGETDNLVYGRTNNPYDLSRTPGGSSGGAAAIVATGGSPLDLGSDTAGSIRIPAHYCGIAGIKPTSGRVSRTGHIISFNVGGLDPLTQIGPMARFVEDLILTLPIIAGPDWCDPAIVPMPLGDPNSVDLQRLRVAFYTDNGIAHPSSETSKVVETAVQALTDAGMAIEEKRPPEIELSAVIWDQLLTADGGATVARLLQTAGTAQMHPSLQWTHSAKAMSMAEYSGLLTRWHLFHSRMLSFMRRYDLIICPVSSSPAVPHGGVRGPEFSYTKPFNLTGWPSIVFRGGTSPEGLPIGVQLVARPWREEVALAAGRYLEPILGGWQRPPE
jgi:amidase